LNFPPPQPEIRLHQVELDEASPEKVDILRNIHGVRGKDALIEFFQHVRGENTPVMVARIVDCFFTSKTSPF
jgi:hypothetical protein